MDPLELIEQAAKNSHDEAAIDLMRNWNNNGAAAANSSTRNSGITMKSAASKISGKKVKSFAEWKKLQQLLKSHKTEHFPPPGIDGNSEAHQGVEEIPGWLTFIDPDCQHPFYQQISTGRVQWERPADNGEDAIPNALKTNESTLLSIAHTSLLWKRKLLKDGVEELKWVQAEVIAEQKAARERLEKEAESLREELKRMKEQEGEPDTELEEALKKLSMAFGGGSNEEDDDDSGIGSDLLSALFFGGLTGEDLPPTHDPTVELSEEEVQAISKAETSATKQDHEQGIQKYKESISSQKTNHRDHIRKRVEELHKKAEEERERVKVVQQRAKTVIDEVQTNIKKKLEHRESKWNAAAQRCLALALKSKFVRKVRALGIDDNSANALREAQALFDTSYLQQYHDEKRRNRKNDNNEMNGAWMELVDEVSSYPYYWNMETGETSWTKPQEMKDLEEESLQQSIKQMSEDQALSDWYSEELSNVAAKYVRERSLQIEQRETQLVEEEVARLRKQVEEEKKNQEQQTVSLIESCIDNADDDEHKKEVVFVIRSAEDMIPEDEKRSGEEVAEEVRLEFEKAKREANDKKQKQLEEHRKRVKARLQHNRSLSRGSSEMRVLIAEAEDHVATELAETKLQEQDMLDDIHKQVQERKNLLEALSLQSTS